MKILQISDTHLVAPGEQVYGLDPMARLQACFDDINEQHPDAEFAVFTGDLAHCGGERAYQLLAELLERLKVPAQLLIGNHDHRQRFQAAFPATPKDANGFVQFSIATSAGRCIGLDTNEPNVHYGRLCRQRLDWLDAQLRDAADEAVYLFMHHPPFEVGLKEMDTIALKDKGAFADIVAARNNVRHIFVGHLHRPLSGSWRNIPFSNLPGTNHQVALDFEVEDGVPGSKEPPAYAVIFLEPGSTLVHLRNFTDRTATFML